MTRRRELSDDEGSLNLFFIVVVVALFALVGLVVDGGGKIRSVERASDVAAQAARQGGEAINAGTAIGGGGGIVDTGAAKRAAQAYLAAAGVQGNVEVTAGNSLTVETTITYTPTFLSAVGVGPQTVHGHAQVLLLQTQGGTTP